MRLRSITVRSMPGIHEPFRLEADQIHDGLNLIVGPNGIGKSSLCRAVRALLWPESEESASLDLEACWEVGHRTLIARRTPAQSVRWSDGGQAVESPSLPPSHLARCYSIGVLELIKPGLQGPSDHRLQEELRRALSGGFDLRSVERYFMAEPQAGRYERRIFDQKRAEVKRLESRFVALEGEEARLQDLRRELELGQEAARRLPLVEMARDLVAAGLESKAWRADMERDFPEGMEAIRGDELETIEKLRERREEVVERLRGVRDERSRAECELAAAGLAAEPPSTAEIEEQRSRLQRLETLTRSLEQVELELAGVESERRKLRETLAGRVAFEEAESIDGTALDRIGIWLRRRAEILARRDGVLESEGLAPPPWTAGMRWAGGSLLLGLLAAGVWLMDRSPPVAVLLLVSCAAGLAGLFFDFQRVRARRRFEVRRREVDARWEELEQEREELQGRFGLDLSAGELEPASLAASLQRWQQAGVDIARREGERARFVEQRTFLVGKLEEFLDQWRCSSSNHGIGGGAPVEGADLDGVRAAFKELIRRCEMYREALRKKEDAERAEVLLTERLEEVKQAEKEILHKAGLEPGSDEELRRRVSMYQEYRARVEKHHRLEGKIGELRRRLEGEEDLAEAAIEDLEADLRRLKEQAARATALQEEVARIEARVSQARSGDEMARALAEREQAEKAVEEAARKHLVRAAGRVLMRRVRDHHARESEPEVLSRAAALLAAFTHNAYALRADPESGEFRLWEGASGKVQRLETLSDGTRAQTLLAARLAFAFEAERDDPVPLWLDEALTAADPERFAAIAESLVGLTEAEGRQIFYLTADPSDIAAWQAVLERAGEPAAEVVDLGLLRRGQATAPSVWEGPPPPSPPADPSGMTADQYGAAIAAPRIDPFASVEAMALFHVLRDDLGLVAHLLEARIERVGQWRIYRRREAAELVVNEEQARRIDAAIEGAESFLRNWRIGRPRPVDGEVLAVSGVLSERFLEQAIEVAAAAGGDAGRLVEALREGRLKRFHRKKIDQLEEYLVAEGFLDPRASLDLTGLRAAVLGELKSRIAAGEITRSQIERLTDQLWYQLARSSFLFPSSHRS